MADDLTRDALVALSEWIDAGNAHRDPEAVTWGRIAKITEEAGEVIAAFIGATGQNPRKGVTHDTDAVIAELLDVAVTALGAVEHLRGHDGAALDLLAAKIVAVAERAGVVRRGRSASTSQRPPGAQVPGRSDEVEIARVERDARGRDPRADDHRDAGQDVRDALDGAGGVHVLPMRVVPRQVLDASDGDFTACRAKGRQWTARITSARQLTPEVERRVITSVQVDRASVLRDAAETVLRSLRAVWPFDDHPAVGEAAEYAAEALRAEAREASS